MVLVDTSVWVRHLRHTEPELVKLLQDGKVACHPFIIGELACGNLGNRAEIISLMHELPMLDVVENEELLVFIENNQIMGTGIGFVDVHLMAAAFLADITIWTYDKKLQQNCATLRINYFRH